MQSDTPQCLSDHWRSFTRNERALRNDSAAPVAVCVLGQMRYFGLAAFNLHWSLGVFSAPHRLFFVGPSDMAWEQQATFVQQALPSTMFAYKGVEVKDLGVGQPLWQLTRGRVRNASSSSSLRPSLLLNVAAARLLGLRTSGGKHVQQRFVNLVVQLWQQTKCAAMVRAHERRTGLRFERLIKARTTLYLHQRMPRMARSQMLWPRYKGGRQDMYFDAPIEAGLRLLDSSPLVEQMQRGEAPRVFTLGLIYDLWRQRLEAFQQQVTAEGRRTSRRAPVELVDACVQGGSGTTKTAATAHPLQAVAAPWCFIGQLFGAPMCRAFGTRLESPDPEDFPHRANEHPIWSRVPAKVRAATRATGLECFQAVTSPEPLRGCEEQQGDPGPERKLDGFRR